MRRERVAESIYVFTSSRYIEVTAGVIVTPEGCVVVDTMPFPSESRQVKAFGQKASRAGIKYVVNTHYHADHTYGNCFFDDVPLIAHKETRRLLQKVGDTALKQAREETPELEEVEIRVPTITYRTRADIRIGGLTVAMYHAPGNSPDGSMIYIAEEKVLFAGDAMMPVPYVVSGDIDSLLETLDQMRELSVETLIQGHGNVLLRGEIAEAIDNADTYLRTLRQFVENAIATGMPPKELVAWDIEQAGVSRIPLGGMVQNLHRANVVSLYKSLIAKN